MNGPFSYKTVCLIGPFCFVCLLQLSCANLTRESTIALKSRQTNTTLQAIAWAYSKHLKDGGQTIKSSKELQSLSPILKDDLQMNSLPVSRDWLQDKKNVLNFRDAWGHPIIVTEKRGVFWLVSSGPDGKVATTDDLSALF